jgi:hypothetical protein
MRRTECRLIVIASLILAELVSASVGLAQGSGPKPTMNVEVDSQGKFIAVTFAGGRPDATKALESTEWRVVAIPHDQNASPVLLAVAKPSFYTRPDNTIDQAQVRLKTANALSILSETDIVVVQFDPEGLGLTALWKTPVKETPNKPATGAAVKQNPDRLVAASSKQTSAIYFSGLYSPGIGSPPQYSIDALVSPQFHLSAKNACNPSLGLNAQAKTNQRPTVDPDSYAVSPSFSMFISGCGADESARFSGRSVLLNWNIFGPEFEAKGKDLNLVSAVMLSNFFRVWPIWSTPTTTKEFFTAYLSPTIGFEFGTNTENGLEPDGSGTIFRGVAGVDLSARIIPRKNIAVKKMLISASYRVRIPAFSEISTNTETVPGSTKVIDVYHITTAARNHVQSELDFMFTNSWGITLKDEYGRLPPAFRLVDNSASVGLVVMVGQAGSNKEKAEPQP